MPSLWLFHEFINHSSEHTVVVNVVVDIVDVMTSRAILVLAWLLLGPRSSVLKGWQRFRPRGGSQLQVGVARSEVAASGECPAVQGVELVEGGGCGLDHMKLVRTCRVERGRRTKN